MRVQSATCSVVVLVLGILATNVGHGDAQSTRRPLIPGLPSLPPMLQGLSLSNLPGISHIMNMPLPFNVPFSFSSLPPLRLPIRLPAILGGAGMIRNATHLIRNTFLGSPLSSSSPTPVSSALSSGSSLNTNSITQMLTAPLLPLLNLGSGAAVGQAATRNGVIDPTQYAQYFRALQLQSAHERRRRSIVQHMIRHYQSSQPFIPTGHLQLLQVPAEQLAQFRTLYRYH
ncbi:uncharacterized protein LOC111264916 [Varroa jacobsoni]|uniref:Uncharacterized protein n=1 Tax=Varroa destructor TaxID=109461 RepID=A0A7M7J621_VARDE|nr:uncharacterized protein LOC111242885 [Varroa destructor]XP_022696914.1 uncharacterized protein LOC111264916 [Varroa jacobsoni]